jgi:hypothetical protein
MASGERRLLQRTIETLGELIEKVEKADHVYNNHYVRTTQLLLDDAKGLQDELAAFDEQLQRLEAGAEKAGLL